MPSRSLDDCDPRLRIRFSALKWEYERRFPMKYLLVTCTYRNPEEQHALWVRSQTGPWLTDKDGLKNLSLHNVLPCLALDVVVQWDEDPRPDVVKMHLEWEDLGVYRPLVPLARRHRLFSGGEWKRPDWPHIELPKEEIEWPPRMRVQTT